MKKISFLFAIITFSLTFPTLGQTDIFSQYYFNELQQNPALTGLFENKWRIKHFRRYEAYDNFNTQNNTWSGDIKVVFNKQAGEYGLNIKEFSGWMMGIGVMDHRVFHDLESDKFRANHISLSFHRMMKNKDYFSFGFQPGFLRMYDDRKFDINAGILYGSKQIECWSEDQFFKTQIGLSAYNLLSDFRHNDSSYFPGRKIQLHGGYLIKEPKQFNIFASASLWYDSKVSFSTGANVLFFPIVHYKYWDRARLGLHYRTSNHMVLSAGLRFYLAPQKTISLDAQISYDFGMQFLDLIPKYKRGIEIGVVLTPLRKCWSLSKC